MLNQSFEYYSNGKILLTSEYLVLKGALALAMPVKYGQSLKVVEVENENIVRFRTIVNGELWLSCTFDSNFFRIIDFNDKEKCLFLSNLLIAARNLNPSRFSADKGLDIESNINFDIRWGLGSSSSLISNIAYLFEIDPYTLHLSVSKGSGYDVACARLNTPILYKLEGDKPIVKTVKFYPVFHENIYFAYTGRKMDSSKSVAKFLSGKVELEKEIDFISNLSKEVLKSTNLDDFNKLVRDHEEVISAVLNEKTIKSLYFNDFDGEVKSLGAWGGDFVMVSSNLEYGIIEDYFNRKNLEIIIPFKEMIL